MLLLHISLQAGTVVQESLSQVRTVTAYNGQERAYALYDSKLDIPQKVSFISEGRLVYLRRSAAILQQLELLSIMSAQQIVVHVPM